MSCLPAASAEADAGSVAAADGAEALTDAASTSTRLPPRRVIYRNAALTSTAPDLGATVHDSELIREAQRIAEEVRDKFKAMKTSVEDMPTVTGEGESADAMRHKRRLQMNRRSAANSRLRRDAYVSALEKQLMKVEVEFRRMEAELRALQTGRTEESSLQENHEPSVELAVSVETSLPPPPPAPSQPDVQTEMPRAFAEDAAVGCPAPPSPSAAANGRQEYLSAHMVHLATNVGRDSPFCSEQSATLSAQLEHLAVLPDESGLVDTSAPDPAGMPLPELISDLAEIEPDFFGKLLSDFESQNGEQAADMFSDEMLSFYKSLPE
jgi:hypothetical protein